MLILNRYLYEGSDKVLQLIKYILSNNTNCFIYSNNILLSSIVLAMNAN